MSVKVMSAVWELDISGADKLVLLAFADHANDDGRCYPSLGRIAWKCGYSRASIKRKVRQLIASGLLEIESVGIGRGNTSRYRVHPEKGVNLSPFVSEKGSSETVKGVKPNGKGVTAMTPEPSVEPSENRQNTLALTSEVESVNGIRTEFERLWVLARRGSKDKAWEQYRKAVPSKAVPEVLYLARLAYVTAAAEPRFVAHLDRWIRDERWLEDVARPRPAPKPEGLWT